MANTFQSGNYSIVTSLNERTIYFKITDKINYITYEGNIDSKELRANVELSDAYTIIINCLSVIEGYDVKLSVNSGTIKVIFNAVVGGFLKMNFEVLLREKVMSNDGQLTLNFNRLEEQLNSSVKHLLDKYEVLHKEMEKKNKALIDLTDKLSFAQIYMCKHGGQPIKLTHFVYLNVKEVTNISGQSDATGHNLELIEKLYQLENLTITTFHYDSLTTAKLRSKTLKTLILNCQNQPNITSLQGLEELPKLESLTIIMAPALTNIPSILKSYKHKINDIKIQNCPGVNVVEMQTYCQTNNIKLEIS